MEQYYMVVFGIYIFDTSTFGFFILNNMIISLEIKWLMIELWFKKI